MTYIQAYIQMEIKVNFCYVILHYKNHQVTIDCIQSLLKFSPSEIVVVDNASNNASLEMIKEKFAGVSQIYYIQAPSNLGFAKGNNLGYAFVKEQLKADFIVCLNNDTEIEQTDFEARILSRFQATPFWILGPDIINVNGNYHQNPIDTMDYSPTGLNDLLALRKKRYTIARLKQVPFLKTFFMKRLKQIEQSRQETHQSVKPFTEDVTLYGACVVYSPLFIKHFDDAFYPETFMFSEEYFLYFLVKTAGGLSVFDPSVVIYHKEHASTASDYGHALKRELFMARHQLDSALKLKHLVLSTRK